MGDEMKREEIRAEAEKIAHRYMTATASYPGDVYNASMIGPLKGAITDLVRNATPSWQPMKTAPRDGTEVLLAVAMRAGIPQKMLVGHWMPGGHCIEDHPPIDEGWYFYTGSKFRPCETSVAWMPLPDFPEVPRPDQLTNRSGAVDSPPLPKSVKANSTPLPGLLKKQQVSNTGQGPPGEAGRRRVLKGQTMYQTDNTALVHIDTRGSKNGFLYPVRMETVPRAGECVIILIETKQYSLTVQRVTWFDCRSEDPQKQGTVRFQVTLQCSIDSVVDQ